MSGGVRITDVLSGSVAEAAGLRPGDLLLSINGRTVSDLLDYRFHSAEECLTLEVASAEGGRRTLEVTTMGEEDLGIVPEPLTMRACNNTCAFCFAHQNPRGVRRALYFKDDDYRFSFLHGNFITMTTLTPQDMERIVEQRLSPLYVSVHSTEHALRNRILGNPRAPDVLGQIAFLTAHKITLHTQVVLCPGLNDGPHLTTTMDDLTRFFPGVASLAVVPVGLTQFRDRLPEVAPVTPDYATRLLEEARPWRRRCLSSLGSRFVFPSDEFYLLAGRPVPSWRSYEGFPQYGNGVGMVRKFVDEFRLLSRRLPARLDSLRRVAVVTGTLAAPFLQPIVESLHRIEGLSVRLLPTPNRFFGATVSAAGLLTGTDILPVLHASAGGVEEVLIPSLAFKDDDDILLDDMTLRELGEKAGVPVRRVDARARALVRALLSEGERRSPFRRPRSSRGLPPPRHSEGG